MEQYYLQTESHGTGNGLSSITTTSVNCMCLCGGYCPIHTNYFYNFARMDKGEKAFKIIKTLIDKKIVKLAKVEDFVDLMDTLIKEL